MLLAAVSIERGWDKIGMVLATLAAIGALLGTIAYFALRQLRSYLDEDRGRKHEAAIEVAEKYKELYRIEKERTEQSLSRLTALEQELGSVRLRLAEVADENHRLMTLNLKLQEDKRKDMHQIDNLSQEIEGLKRKLDELTKSR